MADTQAPSELAARGREAASRRSWVEAFDAFSAADAESPLTAHDLGTWATAAYLVGDTETAVTARARQHQIHVDENRIGPAVRAAFWVAFILANSGQSAQAGGWMVRATGLAESLPDDAPEHGYLSVLTAFRQVAIEGSLEEGIRTATVAVDLGRSTGEEDLVALGLNIRARALIMSGRAAEGLVQLDEAMAAVVSGTLVPPVAGTVYCSLIEACEEILDMRRAQEWTDALNRWCDRQEGMVTFTGQCLTHRAEVLRLRGDLDAAALAAREAEDRFSRASDERLSGGALYQLAEVLRLRGEFSEAEEAYRRAGEWGRDPHPGLALLWLAQGRVRTAAAAMRRIETDWTEPTRRIRMLPAFVEIMLEADDLDAARRASDELTELADTFGTDALAGYAAQARGAVALADGSAKPALGYLRTAVGIWRSLGLVHDTAVTRLLIARAFRQLGDAESAALEAEGATRVLGEIGIPVPTEPAGDTHDLSPRELEVLRLVATGVTNREIADELYLSVKTVDRHVANILIKLGVTSRTAATAHAYEHGLI